MTQRSNKNKPNRAPARRAVVIVMLIALLGFGALAAYVGFTPAARYVAKDERRGPDGPSMPADNGNVTPSIPKDNAAAAPAETSFKVPSVVDGKVVLGAEKQVPEGMDPIVFLANEAVKANGVEGATALGSEVQNRIAYIDFNPALQDGMGSGQESTFLSSLEVALGQIQTIDKFQIRVEGKPLDSLGHFELSEPVQVLHAGEKADESTPDGG